jgi:hypothetical protein
MYRKTAPNDKKSVKILQRFFLTINLPGTELAILCGITPLNICTREFSPLLRLSKPSWSSSVNKSDARLVMLGAPDLKQKL